MIIVYTTGVFDMLHPGHINILKKAKSMGDKLIVGLQNDLSVFNQKGKNTILNVEDRKIMLESLPFVDNVIIYENLDQRNNLKLLKPNIYIQGEDWLKSGNREKIIKYLDNNNIKLLLFPRTKGISTTQIRERVINNSIYINANLESIIKKVSVIDINLVNIYEKSDPIRVKKIKEDFIHNKIIKNPLICIKHGEKFILIDGNNRFKALKQLGYTKMPVFIIDYFDQKEVNLLNNIHYLEKKDLFDIINDNFTLIKSSKKEAEDFLVEKKVELIIKKDDDYFYIKKESTLEKSIFLLNTLVDTYLGETKINRISEIEKENLNGINIVFRKFLKDDIFQLIEKKLFLNSGITWHKFNINFLNLSIDLDILNNDLNYIKEKIKEKINSNDLKHYYGNTYILD